MTKFNIILILIIFGIQQNYVVGQTKLDSTKKYTIDYQGTELSKEDIEKLFIEELNKFDKANSSIGSISMVDEIPNSPQIKPTNSTEQILGETYYNVKKYISNLNKKEFINYYQSIDDQQKLSLIKSSFLRTEFYLIKQDTSLTNYILSEFDRFEKTQSNITSKLKFMTEMDLDGVDSLLIDYLEKVDENTYNYSNSYFIYELIKFDKNKALSLFKKLLNLQNTEKLKPSRIISLDNKKLLSAFILSENNVVRNDFIETSIKTIELGLYNYSKIGTWVYILANSHKLNQIQKERIIKALELSNDETLIHLSKQLNVNLKGITFLNTIDIEKDSIHILDLVPISKCKLTVIEKEEFKNYLIQNKDYFALTSGSDYQLGSWMIHKNLNSKSQITDYITEFNKVGFDIGNINSDSLRMILLSNYPSGQIWNDEFPQFFLNKQFVSKFTANIHFDTESGEFPNDYPTIIEEFKIQLEYLFGIKIKVAQHVNYNTEKNKILSYDVYIESNKIYKIKIEDTGDWYSMRSIISVLNKILQDNEKGERFINVNTGDQTSRYILMEPATFLILDDKFNLNVKDI